MIQLSPENKKWLNNIWDKLEGKLSVTAAEVCDFIPYTTNDKKYISKEITWWTNGFYGGMMWLLYKATGKDIYRQTAIKQELLLDEAFKVYDGLHHDVGFMWNLTAKTHYLIDNNHSSRVRALFAANSLAARINVKSGYISAWPKQPQYSIIDGLMNLPILYWASKELGEDRYRYIAELHADMSQKYHIRDDGSAVHIVVHATDHNEVLGTLAGQGYAEGSAWSRGQAWAIYGFVLSYIHTGNKSYLETAKKAADYFLNEAEKTGYKVPCDFSQPKESPYLDNSAAACAACGMIEVYKATNEEKYLQGAINLLKALEEDCIFDQSDQSILQNCMVSYQNGVQCHLVYGDFFLTEAILKLKNEDFLIW